MEGVLGQIESACLKLQVSLAYLVCVVQYSVEC